MAVLDDSTITALVKAVGSIGLWIQAVGIVVVLWIIFSAITMYFNRKRRMLLMDIDERLKRVERKIDKMVRG